MLLKRSFIFMILALSLFSCHVNFVPAFNASIINDITEGAKMTDEMYLRVIQTDDKSFNAFADEYLLIETQINSIIFKDQARPKSGNIVSIATNLQKTFLKYKAEHKAKGSIRNKEAEIYNEYLQALWKPLLVAEMSLK